MNENQHPEQKNCGSPFQIIRPEEYAFYGIDPQDIPIGTFAAHDHPSFLMSRYGGNAYGFGLVEQNKLSPDDYDFLERIDLNDRQSIIRHADRLNDIYKKLGLLMRFSRRGTRYYLIPINLVAQSVQDVRAKAEAVEKVIADHARATGSERLDVALFTTSQDLIAHDLAARLSHHRLAIVDDIRKLRAWRSPFDVAVFPRDPCEYLIGQPLPKPKQSARKKRRLFRYAGYVAGKVYDLLESSGRVLVLADSPWCVAKAGQYLVEFLSEEEFKKFLLFSHIYKTHQRYSSQKHPVSVHPLDFHFYVHNDPINIDFARETLGVPHPFDLAPKDIDRLPHLDHPLPHPYRKRRALAWEKAFAPYFDMHLVDAVTTRMPSQDWLKRLRVPDKAWPNNVGVFTGTPRPVSVSRQEVEERAKKSGMMGCHPTLTASYRNSFRYVADVLRALIQIRDGRFGPVGEVERDRLINPFRRKELSEQAFLPVRQLLRQLDKLQAIEETLNPDHLEGPSTPVLENLEKLALHGFTPAQLTEMVLIVTGHSAMSRIVLGKMPARNLKPLTDAATDSPAHTVVDKLRICRLMSVAEIAASFGHPLTSVQIDEVFRIYHDAVRVATNPQMDWHALEDQRISEMGGVQYKALREMLKFFNLFEYLNTWYELLDKGPFEREVFCDYDPDKLRQVEQVLQLASMVDRFRSHLHDSSIPRQTFFFRQFLQTEFHGTGHLFPSLGPKCGLKLLWVTVQVSPHRIVNFNPLLAAVPPGKMALRLEKIRQALEKLPVETMPWKELDGLRKTLLKGKPIFLHNSGLRLTYNAATKAIDVSYVDVQENVELIEKLLSKFESCKLKEVSLQEVTQLERLFSEISSYKQYLYEEGRSEADVHQEGPPSPSFMGLRLSSIENRIRHVFLSQILVPEEIFDTVSLLVEHCPNVLRFVMPDLHHLGQLMENRPTRKRQSVGSYIMRCLEKFQALILKDRENFQDVTTYYQMAKNEFGPLATEDNGAKHHQLEILEHFLERIDQERPALTQALTLALLFQDLGKLETYTEESKILERIWTHAERSVRILQQHRTLSQYNLSKEVQDLTLELIRHHGLIGHVIQGSEPITAIELLTQANDKDLLDTFVLHAILAAASVEEGLMTEDLLDLFLEYRHGCLHVMKTGGSWYAHCREKMRHKGQASLHASESAPQLLPLTPPAKVSAYMDSQDGNEDDEMLWRGRQIEAFERLLRLMGVPWVDFHDLQMASMNVPVAFIHHQKGLRSVGLHHFRQNVTKALQILAEVQRMDASLRTYLLYGLDPLGGAFRIYDFHHFPPFLSVQACLNLLALGLMAYHRHWAGMPRQGLVSFRPLSRVVRHRHEILEEYLHDLALHDPSSWILGTEPWNTVQSFLMVETSPFGPGVQLRLPESLQVEALLHAISEAKTHEELRHVYREQLKKLHMLPFVTPEQMEHIKVVYHRRMEEISRELLHEIQNALARLTSFDELDLFRTRLFESLSRAVLSEDDYFLIEDLLDHHRSRLRDEFLTKVAEKVYAFKDREALTAYWNSVKAELFRFRSYIGKEYEAMIASYIDTQLQGSSLEPGP
ncbi:hypothetical protein [Desulfosoma caldarium]|uniref:Uncharacterized protein n=1 Tax=Desulfosoma caldarium TaxID=610254 RepID=A0A3N1UL63_9BACT|nr:hypothetical protein [Desulfosoma caldarium]ROQ90833.1 hypothetical protein EDC27_2088 [Desulfosoma caldarium]